MKPTICFLIFSMMTASLCAFAGKEGGGGKGVVCRDATGAIQSVELLDLWEAREIYKRPAVLSQASVADQVANAIEGLKYGLEIQPGVVSDATLTNLQIVQDDLARVPTLFFKNSNLINRIRGQKLTLTDDSFEPVQPTGNCGIEQVVDYIDAPQFPLILVNQDLLDKMDSTNQAALYVHESLYLYLRGYNDDIFDFVNYRETNSIRTRRAVGYVFAGKKFSSLQALLGKEYVHCEGRDQNGANRSQLFVYKDAQGNDKQIETQIFGRPMIGYFPDESHIGFTVDEVLHSGTCNYPDEAITAGPGTLGIGGVGPVDFQSYNWLGTTCRGKMWVPIIQQDSSTPFAADPGQVLECKMEYPSADSPQ